MKTCLITGATGGVASALTDLLRHRGWRLALVSRSETIPGLADGELAIAADVSTEAGAEAALDRACEAFGAPPDALAHCAGAILIAPLARTGEAQYRACLATNLDSAFFVARAYAPRVQKAKRPGTLLLFSSVAAGIGVANHAAIAIAKGGIEGLARHRRAISARSSRRGRRRRRPGRLPAVRRGRLDQWSDHSARRRF